MQCEKAICSGRREVPPKEMITKLNEQARESNIKHWKSEQSTENGDTDSAFAKHHDRKCICIYNGSVKWRRKEERL